MSVIRVQMMPHAERDLAAVRDSYPDLVDTVEEHFPELPVAKRIDIISLITGVCKHCWSAPDGCRCWDDS